MAVYKDGDCVGLHLEDGPSGFHELDSAETLLPKTAHGLSSDSSAFRKLWTQAGWVKVPPSLPPPTPSPLRDSQSSWHWSVL